MASSRHKTDTPPSAGHWQKLETPGDVRRFLRWLILETKADKIDVKKAGVMGQLGLYLLKTLEVATIAAQVEALEHRLEQSEQAQGTPNPHDLSHPHTTH